MSELSETFMMWAEVNGVSLDNEDDYDPWFDCWNKGRLSLLEEIEKEVEELSDENWKKRRVAIHAGNLEILAILRKKREELK